jgi:hypothetical protein
MALPLTHLVTRRQTLLVGGATLLGALAGLALAVVVDPGPTCPYVRDGNMCLAAGGGLSPVGYMFSMATMAVLLCVICIVVLALRASESRRRLYVLVGASLGVAMGALSFGFFIFGIVIPVRSE